MRKLILLFLPYFLCAQNANYNITPLDSVAFKGYFRTSLGESEGGKTMVNFAIPGGLSHYRLGNEPNTYAEVEFDYNHKLDLESKKSFDLVFMLAGYSGFGDQQPFKLENVTQLYAKMNNVIGNSDIWIGRRYYERRDHHIIDYFWYSPGQGATVGAGIDNIRGKKHKDDIDIAIFNFENKNVRSLNNDKDDNTKGVLQNFILETKWKNIPISENGSVTFWNRLSKRQKSNINYNQINGYGLGVWYDQTNIFKGKAYNTLQISYRKGNSIGKNLAPIYETSESELVYSYDMKKTYVLEVSNQFTFEHEKVFALSAVALYRYEDRGVIPYNIITQEQLGDGKQIHWFSIGTRMIKYLTRHFNLALEAGTDYIDNQTISKKGWLNKITFSPQLSWDYGFYSRPVLRPFITYAKWSDNLIGDVGNAPDGPVFNNKNNGLTYGLSFEIWW